MLQFSTAILKALSDDYISLNMKCTSDVKNSLKLENENFKILTQVCT
jgi:hypothetical protein